MLQTKTTWDISRKIHNTVQKVNFRQYLADNTEPADESSGKTHAALDTESGIIKDIYLRKRVLRKVARQLRMGR